MLEKAASAAATQDRQARERERMLGGILSAGALVLGTLLLLSPLLGNVADAALTYGPGLALHVGHLLWLRRGHASRAVAISHCITYLLWVTSVLGLHLGGLRAPAALVYPPIVLMAGLVWSGQAALVMALSSCVAGAALVWFEARGWLPRVGLPLTPLRLLLVLTACVVVTAVMIRYALAIIERTTREALESEQRHAEQRRRLELDLREAQRIEALGRLAGGVAHDFNNLLTVIMGYAGLLPRDTSEQLEAVKAIELASQRARTLTHQLLAFGRRQVLRPEVLDLSAAVRELQPLFARLLSADIQLQLALSEAPCLARVDRSQLGQVVINLVANARDSMPRGGQLTLVTGSGVPGDWSGEAPLPEGNVWLSVRDTGSGIDASVRAHIFEPFFTTKTPSGGTGLGLATVHGIVTQSGGVVAVESAPGRGSRFLVSLPCAPAAAQAPSSGAARSNPSLAAAAGQHVLVVDDDVSLCDVMRSVLEKAGFSVRAVATAEAALTLIDAGAPRVDLLLSDVVMSGMSGPELARRAREKQPSLPVLFVSGHAPELVDQRGALDSGTEFLAKPFGPTELLQKVEQTLAAARVRARPGHPSAEPPYPA